jgi:hypothetical protein
MSLNGWRYLSEKLLAEKIGPVAELLVSDALAELGVTEQELTASHFSKFVRSLYEKLPDSIDRRALCHELQAAVLHAPGLNRKGG